MPTFTQLEYILAVAEHSHFGRAAQACHITQPTLSQQIQKVEELLGLAIFDRVKKPIVPTPEGRMFLDQARVIIREHKKLCELARSRSEEVSGEFRLAIIPTIAGALLPLFICEFSKRFPKVELHIDEINTETILRELRQDKIDAAIMATPIPGGMFREEPLYYEPFQVYCAPDHRLLRKDMITVDDLDGSEMWLLNDGHCFRNQVIRYCSIDKSDAPLLRNIYFQSGSLDLLTRLVKIGQGYTMIPSLLTSYMSEEERELHVRPFAAPLPTREISLVSHRDTRNPQFLAAIRNLINEKIPQEFPREINAEIQRLDIC